MISFSEHPRNFHIANIIKGILAICFLLKITLLCFTINRGFDIGDEGDLLLMYRNYHLYAYNFFAKLSHGLLIQNINQVYQYRIYKYVSDIYSCVVLSVGLGIWFHRTFIHDNSIPAGHLLIGAILFSLLGFAQSPFSPTLSYNEFTNIFICTVIGLLFVLFSFPKGKAYCREFIISAVIGFFFHLQFTIKREICLALAIILFFSLCFIPSRKLIAKLGYILCFAIGFEFLIHIIEVEPYQQLSTSLKYQAAYSVYNVLYIYLRQDFYHIAVLCTYILLFFLFLYFTKTIKLGVFFYPTAIIIPLVATYFIHHISLYDLQLDFQICIIANLILLWVFDVRENNVTRPKLITFKNIYLLLLIIVLPLLLIAGTNSTLSQAMPAVTFPWFALAGILLFYMVQRISSLAYLFVLAAGLILSTSFQFIHNRIFCPFMLKENIFQNNVSNKYLSNIKTDSATVVFCGQIADLMNKNGYKPGDTIVTMGFTSGIAYMLDARMELTAFYLPDGWGDSYNCYCLKTIQSCPKFIILPTDQINKYNLCLSNTDRDLFANYDFIDSIYNPYSNSYYRNTDPYLHVFKIKTK